jgi:hypothetical protein
MEECRGVALQTSCLLWQIEIKVIGLNNHFIAHKKYKYLIEGDVNATKKM